MHDYQDWGRVNHRKLALTIHHGLYERRLCVVDIDAPAASPPAIEGDVRIGHNVVILPGCKHIGRGAVVGAGSIVKKDVESNAIVTDAWS